MVRPGLMPIACAVALTAAAGLSMAAEHARSFHAAAVGSPVALPAPPGTDHADTGRDAADGGAVDGAEAAVAPSPSVGSRALTGTDEECPPADRPQRP
jgi:hypothetical protein